MDLESLKVDLSGLSDEEAEQRGLDLFLSEFFEEGTFRGEFGLHDGQKVVVFQDRYEHAFKTSKDRSRRPYAKDEIARNRIERVRWIKPALQGKISGTECWLVPDRRKKQRLYIIVDEQYLIWLEERKDGGWKFSSAYCVMRQDIQRYRSSGVKIWSS